MAIVAKLTSGSALSAKLTSGSNTLTLKNTGAGAGTRIDNLGDVDTSVSSANGSILVYNNVTDTYVQRNIVEYDNDRGAYKLDKHIVDCGEDGF
jgi:high-affinity K+ transport system ATPase subunit B